MQAAACAQWDEPPPDMLREAWACLRFNTLPEDGNLWSQPAGLIGKYGNLLNIYDSFKARDNASDNVAFAEQYPSAMKTVGRIEKLRMLDGNTS